MPITGADFETLVQPFFKQLFEKLGFVVIQVRKQESGSQNGFDISVLFHDKEDIQREIFIECKYYTTAKLYWSEIMNKQIQLAASNHSPTAFIALSPRNNLSNINHNIQAYGVNKFKFPVDFWTPDKQIERIFALDKEVYKKIYDKPNCDITIIEKVELKRVETMINSLIQSKEALKFADWIRIIDSHDLPKEDVKLKTTLDEKLNALFDESDPKRLEYHRIRANYKIYLEELYDVNSDLRLKILDWESDLRLKADRLTYNFNIDQQYTAQQFFSDFFNIAEKELNTFYEDYQLKGHREKLLQGVVFELAAQCPLDWRKNE